MTVKIEDLQIGTKLSRWYDEGITVTLIYYEVLKVGKKMVQVRGESGGVAWRYPWYFEAIVKEETYQRIMAESHH